MTRAVVAFALAWLSAVGCAGCGGPGARAGSALGRVRASGELRWGADEQGGEPYVYEDQSRGGAVVGFEVELAGALALALGVRARLVQNDWSTLLAGLERGTFDVALNGIEVTPTSSARVAFTRPYYFFAERLVARRGDARVRDLPSLAGLRVGTLANSQAWDLLREAHAVSVAYEGVEEPFVDLAHGRTDAVLLDDIIVARYIGRHPSLVVVGDVAEGRYAIATRPADDDLRGALDAALGTLITSGWWRATLARYGLDNRRQDALGVAGPASAGAASASASPASASPRPLSGHQLLLFTEGALVTLVISLAAMALAAPLGLALALARLESRALRPFATAYVELVRGTPVLLQLYVLYFGLANVIALGPWTAAIVGLGLNYAAYEAEIYRAAIGGVPLGQWEAAASLGMSRLQTFRRVILPQAVRSILPPMTNDFVALFKDTSVVSIIAVTELSTQYQILTKSGGGYVTIGLCTAALYLIMSVPLGYLSRFLEKRWSVKQS